MPDMDAYDIIRFFSELFNVPTKYFQFPDTIFYFIIPFITIVFLFYTLLNRKLRIFRNPGINLIIATIISFFSAFMVTVFPPAWTVSIVLGCAILIMGRFSYKRLILTGLIFGLIQWLYPWVMGIFL